MQATVKLLDGVNFSATADSGYPVMIDGPPNLGGQGRGARPMELLLMGMGGCTAFDVLGILRKARQEPEDCRVELSAERATEIPNVFTHVHVHFVLTGCGIKPATVQRAIELSARKYCSASIMLGKTAAITHDFEIIDSE